MALNLPLDRYGDTTDRMGASKFYELNAPKYMYGGYLDSSEVLDLRGKQTSEYNTQATGLALADISAGQQDGLKIIVMNRATRVPMVGGFDDSEAAEWVTGMEAAYFVSFHARTSRVMVHAAPSKNGIAGYFSSGSVVEAKGVLRAGEFFTDSATGFTARVGGIQAASATVSITFSKTSADEDSCSYANDGALCTAGASPLPAVCQQGRCEVVAPGVKCGRFLDLESQEGFPATFLGRYTRTECPDDPGSCRFNGRAQYVHSSGRFRMAWSSARYWIINLAENDETVTSRYAMLMNTAGKTDSTDYAKPADLRALADPSYVGWAASPAGRTFSADGIFVKLLAAC